MAKTFPTLRNNMQRGFIQIPILIAIVVALLGGGAFVAYEVTKPSQNASPEVFVETETQATTTAGASITEQINEKGDTSEEKDSVIDSLKKQVNDLTQKVNAPKTEMQNTVIAPKTTTVTLPSGAIVEMDANGNIIRTIKEAPQQTNTAPTQTTQNTNTEQSTNNSTQPPAPKPAPKYSIEYENFSHGYVNSNQYTSTLKYRLRSVSDTAPDIVKIVSRIYVVAATQEFAATLDTWVRNNNVHFATFNDQSNLEYLGTARIIVQEGGASVFKEILIFEKTYYGVYIPARNVSSEMTFSINQGGLFPGGYISTIYLNTVSIDSTDGNIYKIEE